VQSTVVHRTRTYSKVMWQRISGNMVVCSSICSLFLNATRKKLKVTLFEPRGNGASRATGYWWMWQGTSWEGTTNDGQISNKISL